MTPAERVEILAAIAGENPPSAADAYNRQKRRGQEYDGQREALRRVLRRFFPSDTQLAQQLRPAAERALQEAADAIERGLNR